MSELLVLRALLFAGECFAASVLLPLLAFAVTAMVRRAALRHLIWTAMFGVLAVLPVVALLLPPRRIVERPCQVVRLGDQMSRTSGGHNPQCITMEAGVTPSVTRAKPQQLASRLDVVPVAGPLRSRRT